MLVASMHMGAVSLITCGLRHLQGAKHFKDIQYAPGVTYGEMFLQNEYEMSGEKGPGVFVCTENG